MIRHAFAHHAVAMTAAIWEAVEPGDIARPLRVGARRNERVFAVPVTS
jgi:hypothetical protein